MRAFLHTDPTTPPTPADLPLPAPGPGEVAVRIAACGLNFADLLMLEGTYQATPPLPFVPGLEAAGTITAAGPGTRLAPGTRVAIHAGHGGLAEAGVFAEDRCTPLPDSLDFETAAAFQIAYGTSHLALTLRGRLRAGETLVVLGAAGGVGLTAVEIGARLGARVIAVARGAEKCAIAAQAGAAETLDAETPDLKAALKALGGADVVYDAVGGALGEAGFAALKPGGRFLLIGFAAGAPPALKLNHALVKNLEIHGLYWGGYLELDPAALRRSMTELFALAADGQLHPHISARFPLSQTAAALEMLRARRSTGKIVVTMG
ncbi:NADPH:quinone oxidoreductase family protein [Rhodobacter capsulatus]|uniref:NADPH:quinone oxidoreductase family protein n=1 Tax=Rhodobacter capsulatus TaxID=1061 RepID=UPI0006DD282A|nr:NADPH:quinone oxidoreductase family protein [Rhodobacter capsulatus]KQB11467.1 zinc-binding dehydrogenase [Rhodobacter capsulatus]KQB12320.1 zinc-binding dehydrogenase [Rhodobacter capsulatus]PZX25820.1 NADPH2:quinone reductase [Rhodobacter capsulatus]QNR64121.1 NADPH:quinone oxidoreductase family protein [Rhodobacter capsulatus]